MAAPADYVETVECGECGNLLSATMLTSESAETPCPTCRSTKKHIRLNLSDEMKPPLDALEGKMRDGARRSKEKVRHSSSMVGNYGRARAITFIKSGRSTETLVAIGNLYERRQAK
jgi:hypothetical protein